MNLNGPEADHLYVLLMSGGIAAGYMAERMIHAAMTKASQNTEIGGFFGRDSVIFLLTVIASLVALLPAILNYGVSNVASFLAQGRQQDPWLGWGLTLLVLMNAVAPFIVGIFLLIGRRKRRRYMGRWAI